MKKLLLFCLIVLLTACAAVPRPNNPINKPISSQIGPPPYDAWNRVLQKFVDDQGRVNFAKLA